MSFYCWVFHYCLFQTKWGFSIAKQEDCRLVLTIYVPVNALVACYTMSVEAAPRGKRKKGTVTFPFNRNIFVLFNPWHKGKDSIYLLSVYKKYFSLNITCLVYF